MQGNFNFWSIILLASIAQGLFLISILILRPSENKVARALLITLITAVLLVNLDYFFISSGLFNQLPHLLGISFGLMYVFGPLFYLYLRSVSDISFIWKPIQFLHFLPWIINTIVNYGFYFLSENIKVSIVNNYLAGKTAANGSFFYLMNSIQVLHLSLYLVISYRFIKLKILDKNLTVPIQKRIGWLKALLLSNLVFVISFVCWFIVVCFRRYLMPPIDYINTLICSAMVFMIGYKLVLNPEVLMPGFVRKYKSSSLTESDFDQYLFRLKQLMEKEKLFTEPNLKLNEVADQVGITPHKLSQIINQQFGKSFQDFLNGYRVEEFKKIVYDDRTNNISILAIAMKAGFNSKSAFNAAFRKIANESPTEFKNRVDRNQLS